MTKEEVVAQLNTMIRPPRPDVIEAVANFVVSAIAGTFDAEAQAVAAKQARLEKLEAQTAALQAEVDAAVAKRPELAVEVKAPVKGGK